MEKHVTQQPIVVRRRIRAVVYGVLPAKYAEGVFVRRKRCRPPDVDRRVPRNNVAFVIDVLLSRSSKMDRRWFVIT